MADLLRLESARFYGNQTPGCAWSFFHVFDSYQRRGTKKMLSYRRMVHAQCSAGTDIHIENDEAAGEDGVVDKKEMNIIMEQKGNNMKRNSGKARILKFISKKLLRSQKHRGKASHSSSELNSTISIRHSESNYYVPQDDFGKMTSDSETSTSGLHGSIDRNHGALGALNTDSNARYMSCKFYELGNHLLDEHIILKEKLFEARDALLKQKDTDPNGMTMEFLLQSKIFLDTLQLFNANREAIYNICNGQNSLSATDVNARGLSRTLSLSDSEISGKIWSPLSSHKQIEDVSFVNQVPVNTFVVIPSIEVLPVSSEQRKQRESKTVLSRLRVLKQRIKGVIVENRKERHRISMDRILHKIPSGRKLLDNKENHKLHLGDGSVSEKYYRGGQRFKFDGMAACSPISKIVPDSIQRSCSLAESMDRYSQLLDSISSNERRRTPERSNSCREVSGLQQRKLSKTHGRMLSNPGLLRSYSYSKDIQREAHLLLQLSVKETSQPDGSDMLNSTLVMLPAVEEIDCEQTGSLESNNMVNSIKAIVSDKILSPNVEISTTDMKEHGSQTGSISIMEEESVWLDDKESTVDDSPNVKPDKSSPVSVLDSNIEEPISPLKLSAPAGSELQLLHDDYLKEQHPIPELCTDSNDPNVAELSKPDFYEKISTTVSNLVYSPPSLVDEKYAAELAYVKHILCKYGYDSLFSEKCNPSDEDNMVSRLLLDVPYEEQLMYDLIHEVLFDIYEYSTAPSPWLPHFHSKIRSMPVGTYLLEEVWSEIRWHFYSPEGFSTSADDIFTRIFAKGDGWMNIYRDAECYGLLLEQLILDDLVDEIILDSDGL